LAMSPEYNHVVRQKARISETYSGIFIILKGI